MIQEKKEKYMERAFFKQNEQFMDKKGNESDEFDFSTLFANDDDRTVVTITDSPYEKPISIYNTDETFFTEWQSLF